MDRPLEWTDDNHAYRGRAHYHLEVQPSGDWHMNLFETPPGGAEDKLGHYVMATFEDARELAQGLADQRARFGYQ